MLITTNYSKQIKKTTLFQLTLSGLSYFDCTKFKGEVDSAMLHNFGFGWRIGLKFCRIGLSSNCSLFHVLEKNLRTPVLTAVT